MEEFFEAIVVIGLFIGLPGYFLFRRYRSRGERAAAKERRLKRAEKRAVDEKRWLESPVTATAVLENVQELLKDGRHEDAIALGEDVINQVEWFRSESGKKKLKRSGRLASWENKSDLLERIARIDLMLAVAEAKITIAERTGDLGLARQACRLATRAQKRAEGQALMAVGYEDPIYTQMDICDRRADLFKAQGKEVPDDRF
jgi:hypothetical protein